MRNATCVHHKLLGHYYRKPAMAARPRVQLDQEYETRFDTEIKQNETKRLKELSALSNQRSSLDAEENRIQHLSIKTILKRTLDTMVEVLDDVTKRKSLTQVIWGDKGDRPLYIGLVIVTLALCLYIIDVTS